MALHNVFNDVLNSETKIRILRFYTRHPEMELTKRELARMIGMSHTAVNAAVPALEALNILGWKPAGNAHVYRMNKDSFMYPALCELFEQERAFKPRVLERIRSGLKEVGKCTLFGSFARGDDEYNSDIDLLIITKNKRKAQHAADELFHTVQKEYGYVISPMIMTKSEYEKKKGKAVFKNIEKEGIVLVE